MNILTTFHRHSLDDRHSLLIGMLPGPLTPDAAGFEALWAMHPAEFHQIKIHGRFVHIPRWQQAYGMDYRYAGQINKALPIPEALVPLLQWLNQAIDQRLNGILLNWYDGQLGHYIGRHRDSTINLVHGAPIVTVSFGEERVFRLRPWRRSDQRSRPVDFHTVNGTIFVVPFATNFAWTHEVPHFRRWCGRRISVTFRAFDVGSFSETIPCSVT